MRSALGHDLPVWMVPGLDREWLARNVFAARVHDRWSAGLRKLGYGAGSVAVDVREVSDDGAEYVGRYLAKAAQEELWNVLLDVRGVTAEQVDEAVAATDIGGEDVREISRKDWYGIIVRRPDVVVQLLELAEFHGTLPDARYECRTDR